MEEKLPFELPSFEGDLKNDGTDLGTFKSVKTLKDAYDSLRSCFTKNAMELAKMKKNMQNNDESTSKTTTEPKNAENKAELCAKSNNTTPNGTQNEENSQKNDDLNDFRQEISSANEGEVVPKIEENGSSDKVEVTPDENLDKAQAPKITSQIWESADWNEKVNNFFEEFPDAKNHSKEIAEMLVKDKAVQSSEAPLLNSWVKILQKNEQKVDINDDFIAKSALNNQKIYNLIVNDYLNRVKTHKSAPSVIAKAEGAQYSAEVHKTVQNMAEARELAKNFFK